MAQYNIQSLNAVTTDGNGTVLAFDKPVEDFAMRVTVSGTTASAILVAVPAE